MKIIEDYTPKLAELDEKLLKLNPFERAEPCSFKRFWMATPIDLLHRLAFFMQRHGIDKGKEISRIASSASLAYSEWSDQNGALPYYAYALSIFSRPLSEITPPFAMVGSFSKNEIALMVESISTQAELTREYLFRTFGAEKMPLYRGILKRDRKTGKLTAYGDTRPNRLIFSGTLSKRIAREFSPNPSLVNVPLSAIFDSWLTNPSAFRPSEDSGHQKLNMKYDI